MPTLGKAKTRSSTKLIYKVELREHVVVPEAVARKERKHHIVAETHSSSGLGLVEETLEALKP